MDLLIPFLFLCSFAGIITYSSIQRPDRKGNKKEQPEKTTQFAHPPMDLRLKREVDTNGKSRQGNDTDCG